MNRSHLERKISEVFIPFATKTIHLNSHLYNMGENRSSKYNEKKAGPLTFKVQKRSKKSKSHR